MRISDWSSDVCSSDLQEALRSVVRGVLEKISGEGMPGDHHLYVTFRTGHPGVAIPQRLRETYPEEMTIVLQHQFFGLEIKDDAFEVTLSFNRSLERLRVPFAALTAFVDPSVNFGLQLDRTSVVSGKSVSVRVDLGGRRILKKKKH